MDSKVMSTPKTPGSRIRQRFNMIPLTHSDPDDDPEVTDALKGLVKQTWNLWAVSSLFGCKNQSDRQLKLYAKKLREEVASILPKDDVTYDVEFIIDETITPRPSLKDPPAIKIKVYTRSFDGELEKCVYTGILLSWGTSLAELDNEKSLKLPLLLCRGTKNTMKAVHTTLGHMFDCSIVALSATEEDLKWLVPVVIQPDDEEKEELKGQVKLKYKRPGKPTSDSITVTYEIPALIELWNVICNYDKNAETGFLLKNIDRFFEVLNEQMLAGSGLQLGLLNLTKINLPVLTIMDNKMKATTSEVLHKVLLFFNERAIDVLHSLSLDPTMSSNNITS